MSLYLRGLSRCIWMSLNGAWGISRYCRRAEPQTNSRRGRDRYVPGCCVPCQGAAPDSSVGSCYSTSQLLPAQMLRRLSKRNGIACGKRHTARSPLGRRTAKALPQCTHNPREITGSLNILLVGFLLKFHPRRAAKGYCQHTKQDKRECRR